MAAAADRGTVSGLLSRHNGVLKLRPELVHRFYQDLNRLGQPARKAGQFIPERWIASSVEAVNPPPIPSGGLSMLADARTPTSLRDAIHDHPIDLLGETLFAAHGAEFRVLVKLLDPGEPIVFHLHATDRQVSRFPQHFKGHRFGKDEAYYFMEAPKGPSPYTHAGLYPGVKAKELTEAVRKGRDYALELSPQLYQEYGTGFFTPAGIPHRPGTSLTLEIQQPSDVYTLLETFAGGKHMSPRQIHPGFKSLDEAMELVDYKLAYAVGRLSDNVLIPKPHGKQSSGGEVVTIFPAEICGKFAGRRIRLQSRVTYREDLPFALLLWRGDARINGRRYRAGEEAFVSADAARRGVDFESTGREPAEIFTFLPVV